MRITEALARARAFESEAHQILAQYESSPSRVVKLNETYADLDDMSIKQDELFRQSLRCVEEGLYRAAHVMAWAGVVDLIFERLSEDNLDALRAARPKWQGADIYEMAEHYSEHAIVEVLRKVNLATKNSEKTLLGLLHRRNQCAHPTDYWPGLNETLGYISETLGAVKHLQSRTLMTS